MTADATEGETGSRGLRVDPILGVIVALTAVALPVYALVPEAGRILPATTWTLVAVTQLVQALMCLSAIRLPGAAPADRRFWGLFAAGSACFGVSSMLQLALSLADPDNPDAVTGGTSSGIMITLGAVFLILALLTSPLGLTGRRERLRFWLDTAAIMVSVALLVWQLAGVPATASAGRSSVVDVAVALVGPAAFLVMVFGILKILLGGAAPFTPLAGLIGMTAAALEAVTVGLAEPLMTAGRAPWLLALALLANAFFAVAVRVHLLQVRVAAVATVRRQGSTYHPLPYLTILITLGLLAWVLFTDGLTAQAWTVLVGVVLSTVLVVVRQVAAFADNSELLERLHRALTERDELAGRLRHQAFHDSLTGVANRALFLQRLADALAADHPRAVVAVTDLDGFKPINDRLGHAAGDALLCEVAARLTGCVSGPGLVARLGGDEFAVLLERPGERDVAELPDLIAAAVGQPVALGEEAVRVRISVGVAVARPGDTPGQLVHRADLAMYTRKRQPAAF